LEKFLSKRDMLGKFGKGGSRRGDGGLWEVKLFRNPGNGRLARYKQGGDKR